MSAAEGASSESPSGPLVHVRDGDEIRPAPPADQQLARSYAGWPDKGAVAGGRRITLLAAPRSVARSGEVRVVHVAEAVGPEASIYPMGPKPVLGEEVDGAPATPPAAPAGDPLQPPGLYDGPVVPGPAIDFGYEITCYRFETPGTHAIVWRLDGLVSNTLLIDVA